MKNWLEIFGRQLLLIGVLTYTVGADALVPRYYISQSKIGTTGYLITKKGHYFLTEDVSFAPVLTGTAITVLSSDVILDLGGFSLTQSNTATADAVGIAVRAATNDVRNVTLKNGVLDNFSNNCFHIALSGTQIVNAVTIENLTCMRSGRYGISADASTAGQVLELLMSDCKFLNNALGGGYFNDVDKVQIKNSKFNTNIGTGLIVQDCEAWNIDGCEFNLNISATGPAFGMQANNSHVFEMYNSSFNLNRGVVAAYGLNATNVTNFYLHDSQFNENETTGTAATGVGLNVAGSASLSWQICKCSFNYNGNKNASGFSVLGCGAQISTGATTGGFLFMDSNFVGNISFNSSTSAVAIGLNLILGGSSAKRCYFGGNLAIGSVTEAAGIKISGVANQCIDCVAENNDTTGATSTARGYYIDTGSNGTNLLNCRAFGNRALTAGGAGIGFDLTGTTSICVVRDCQAYSNQGTLSVGFRDSSVTPNNWFAGNSAFGHSSFNYSAVIGTPVSFLRNFTPTSTAFDTRSIDNISIT